MSKALHLFPTPKHTPQPQGLARPPPMLSVPCLKRPCWALKWNHWFSSLLLAREWVLLKGWAGSCLPRATPGLSCILETGRELRVPGSCSTRARGAKAEPHPPTQTQRTSLSMEGEGAQAWGAKARSTSLREHTHPFLSRGVAPAPRRSARVAPVSRQSLEPLSPPLSRAAPGISRRPGSSLAPRSPFPKAVPNQPRRPQLR